MVIFEELYHGNIRPDSRQYAKDSPYMLAVRERQENKDKLFSMLPDEGKELFEAYERASAKISEISRYDTYSYTLRFAIMLMTEAFMCGGCSDYAEGGD